jgi:hypothetical protein
MVVLVAGLASTASAQVGKLGVYSDTAGNSCNITDAAPAIVPVYVVHKFDPGEGATAARFKLQTTNVTMSPVGASSPFAVLGTWDTGVSIGYGSCQSAAVVIITINFFGSGTNPACGRFDMVPDPFAPSGTIQITNCDFGDVNVANGGSAIVNPNGTCQCNIAVNQSTWGGVKALYK